MFDFKFILAIIASLLAVVAYFSYFRDIFKRKTKPHFYTWFIWAITQGTGSVGILYGGGNFGAISVIIGTVLIIVIAALSFKFGTKNITKRDTIVLALALLAIFVWLWLKNPFLSILMVSVIDGVGYIPTFRKTYQEPWSETTLFWFCMAISTIITIISNAEYNFFTVAYLAVIAIANTTMVAIITWRRRKVKAN